MATFTPDQQDQLRTVLGYASVPNLLQNELREERTQFVVDRALTLVDEMADIDTKLKAARADSMAVAVGKLELNYRQHIAHLNFDGSRLLKELGQLLGIQVIYNKYKTGCSPSTRSYW